MIILYQQKRTHKWWYWRSSAKSNTSKVAILISKRFTTFFCSLQELRKQSIEVLLPTTKYTKKERKRFRITNTSTRRRNITGNFRPCFFSLDFFFSFFYHQTNCSLWGTSEKPPLLALPPPIRKQKKNNTSCCIRHRGDTTKVSRITIKIMIYGELKEQRYVKRCDRWTVSCERRCGIPDPRVLCTDGTRDRRVRARCFRTLKRPDGYYAQLAQE